ncbi:MAG TPA: GDSL-type esterase/lipase family protein [Solirubrobacteraceae bacterium]|nr:GDSL-type esterase/lipase family protein [Solirubrobacteraceae bacterium]
MTDRRILFFGDSFVAGSGDPEGRGWVGRVAATTWAAGMPLLAYVLGVRRETSVQIAERWRAEAAPRLLDGADCRVVLSFGTNDATLERGAPRVAPGVSVATLERVLDEAAQLRLPAFVVGPPPSCDDEQDVRVADLSRSFALVCAVRGVPFAAVTQDLAASAVWRDEAAAGDGVHPGAGGYEALAGLVLGGGWLDWLR